MRLPPRPHRLTPAYVLGAAFDGQRGYFIHRQHLAAFFVAHKDVIVVMHHAPFDLAVIDLVVSKYLDTLNAPSGQEPALRAGRMSPREIDRRADRHDAQSHPRFASQAGGLHEERAGPLDGAPGSQRASSAGISGKVTASPGPSCGSPVPRPGCCCRETGGPGRPS